MKVYAAQFSPFTAESAMGVLSLHATREGAQAAVEQHRAAEKADYEQWQEEIPDQDPWDDATGDGFMAWGVTEYEVLP